MRKSKHWNQLSSDKCQMALSTASIDGELITMTLPTSGTEFFLVYATSAKSVIKNYVGSMFPMLVVSYLPLLIHYLQNLMIVWSQGDCSEGVSIFFTPSCMPDTGAFRPDLASNLEASQGGRFSAEMVQGQTNAMRTFFPARFMELLHQAQNFYAIFAGIFGIKSCITESLAFVMSKINKNKRLFIMSF